jgi:hypothetical protein
MSSNFSADQSAQGVYDVAVEVVPHQDIVPLNSEGRPVPLRPVSPSLRPMLGKVSQHE